MSLSSAALVGSWAVLLAGVLAWPTLSAAADPGDRLTRDTVRLALVYYAAAATLMLRPGPRAWRAARWCWTLAWAAYLVHVAMAFHHYHHWSHAAAFAHTRAVSGVGEGVYVSHAFTLLWTLDVAWWWLRLGSYTTRPPWVGRALHGFLFFVVFNATVVYETGFIRWAGLALTAWLGALFWLRAARRPATTEASPGEPGT